MREKPKVGQILYSLNVGNAARNCEQKLTKVEVTKVGRKYFTCTRAGWKVGTVYTLEDWSEHTNYSADSELYATEQAWLDKKERLELLSEMRSAFAYGTRSELTLSQLKAVVAIVRDSK